MEVTSAKSIHALPQRLLRQYIYRQANTLGIFNMQTGGVVVSNSPSKKKKEEEKKGLDSVASFQIRLTGDSKLPKSTKSMPIHLMEKGF